MLCETPKNWVWLRRFSNFQNWSATHPQSGCIVAPLLFNLDTVSACLNAHRAFRHKRYECTKNFPHSWITKKLQQKKSGLRSSIFLFIACVSPCGNKVFFVRSLHAYYCLPELLRLAVIESGKDGKLGEFTTLPLSAVENTQLTHVDKAEDLPTWTTGFTTLRL